MNAPQSRQEAHEAHKARRLRMAMPAFVRLEASAPVLPMVRVDPVRVAQVLTRSEQRKAYNARQRAGRAKRRQDAEMARTERAAVLLAHVAAHHGVSIADLRGRSQTRRMFVARQVAMLLLIDVLGFSMGQAAAAVARTHHTTALAAVRSVRCRVAADEVFGAEVARLKYEMRVKLSG